MSDEETTRTCPSCGGVMQFNTHTRLGQVATGESGPELLYGPGWECQTEGCGEVAPAGERKAVTSPPP